VILLSSMIGAIPRISMCDHCSADAIFQLALCCWLPVLQPLAPKCNLWIRWTIWEDLFLKKLGLSLGKFAGEKIVIKGVQS